MNINHKLAHIGIVVKNIEKAKEFYSVLLQSPPIKEIEILKRGIRIVLFETPETKIELLSPLNENSEISGFLQKRGEGIHHIAFYVDSIDEEIERLSSFGVLPVGSPGESVEGKKILFLHPKTTGGVLIELIESPRQ